MALETKATSVDLSSMDAGELWTLIARCKEALHPVAVIVDNELVCQALGCGHKGEPSLVEDGYMVTHTLVNLEGNMIEATGFGNEGISDEGDQMYLECQQCIARYRLPAGMEVNWL